MIYGLYGIRIYLQQAFFVYIYHLPYIYLTFDFFALLKCFQSFTMHCYLMLNWTEEGGRIPKKPMGSTMNIIIFNINYFLVMSVAKMLMLLLWKD